MSDKILYILLFIAFCYGGRCEHTTDFYEADLKEKLIRLLWAMAFHIFVVFFLQFVATSILNIFSWKVSFLFILCTGCGGACTMIIVLIHEYFKKFKNKKRHQ